MSVKYDVFREDKIIKSDDAEGIRIWVEEELEKELGFLVMLVEYDEDDELEIYIHTDNYEDLGDSELEKLDELEITEVNSINALSKLLNFTIEQQGGNSFVKKDTIND